MNFRPKNENELALLSDDDLIAEIVAARDAGDNDQARLALSILAFRRYPDVVRRVSIKVPKADVEDVAMEALSSAVKSAFDGTSVGEFVNWLATITKFRIADYHRSRPDEPDAPLPEEREGDEGSWGQQPSKPDFTDDLGERLDMTAIIEQAFGELSGPHQAVVDSYVFEGMKAKETADQVNMSCKDELTQPMTDAYVHQIAKRFRERLKELLEESRGAD